jgi:hypothetical protein
MARSIEMPTALARPVGFLPESWRVPLMGWLWVLFNILVVALGLRLKHETLCSMIVGGVDGTVISVIAVAKASAKFQAMATGLLSGMGLNKIGSHTNFLTTVADTIHCFVDSFMDGFRQGSCSGTDSPFHLEVQTAVLQIVWTAMFVILASLIAEWARTSRYGPESQ